MRKRFTEIRQEWKDFVLAIPLNSLNAELYNKKSDCVYQAPLQITYCLTKGWVLLPVVLKARIGKGSSTRFLQDSLSQHLYHHFEPPLCLVLWGGCHTQDNEVKASRTFTCTCPSWKLGALLLEVSSLWLDHINITWHALGDCQIRRPWSPSRCH